MDILPRVSLSNGSSSTLYPRIPKKEMSRSFACINSPDILGITMRARTTILRNSVLALDYKGCPLSTRIICKRCNIPVAKFSSYSDGGLDSYSTDPNVIQTKRSLLGIIKEGIGDLVGISSNPSYSRSVESELVILALPAIVERAIDPLAQLMETAYIGRLGAVELASVGVSMSIFNVISKLFNIPLLSVTTSFVAEDISKCASGDLITGQSNQVDNGDLQPKVHEITERKQLPSVSTALFLAATIGIIEGAALYFGAGMFLNIMGISLDSPMRGPSRRILSLRALGAPAVVLSLAVQGVFRGFKDTKTPMLCTGVGNLSAAFLFPLLMYFCGLGITGAAIATVTSQYIITFLLLWFLSKKVKLLPPKLEDLQFSSYLKSGGLLLGRTLAVLVTMTLSTSMAARLGPSAMAAHQLCFQLWLAVSLLADAMAMSGQAMIASAFSKGEYKRVKEITYCVLKTGLFTGISLAIILCACFGSIVELFSKDAEVLSIVRTGVLFVCGSQPINALAFVFDGLLFGICDFAYAARSMITISAISSAFLFYAPSIFGLYGVWSGLAAFMTLRYQAGPNWMHWS
ncbi:hypothetical protein AMTRI_Chr09g14480 [Amborella trichopoda]